MPTADTQVSPALFTVLIADLLRHVSAERASFYLEAPLCVWVPVMGPKQTSWSRRPVARRRKVVPWRSQQPYTAMPGAPGLLFMKPGTPRMAFGQRNVCFIYYYFILLNNNRTNKNY